MLWRIEYNLINKRKHYSVYYFDHRKSCYSVDSIEWILKVTLRLTKNILQNLSQKQKDSPKDGIKVDYEHKLITHSRQSKYLKMLWIIYRETEERKIKIQRSNSIFKKKKSRSNQDRSNALGSRICTEIAVSTNSSGKSETEKFSEENRKNIQNYGKLLKQINSRTIQFHDYPIKQNLEGLGWKFLRRWASLLDGLMICRRNALNAFAFTNIASSNCAVVMAEIDADAAEDDLAETTLRRFRW